MIALLRDAAQAANQAFWIGAFGCAAAGAAFGAASHGLPDLAGSATQRALWILALALTGAAGILFALAGTSAAFPAVRMRALVIAAAIAFVAYAAALAAAPRFRTAAVVTGLSLAALAVAAAAMASTAPRAAGWIAAGVAVSVVAIAAQRMGILAGRHFNHNDLFHVLQLAGFYCLYRAAVVVG